MRISRVMAGLGSVVLALGCGSDTKTVTAPDSQYWNLQLNNPALTLATVAPYDTATLVLTPVTYEGTAITGAAAGTPTFTPSDTSVIAVSPSGVITGKATGQATVTATLTIGNLTLSTTTAITVNVVTPPPPVFTQLQLQGQFSAFSGTITPVCLDAYGNPINNTAVYLWTSDSSIATTDQYGDVTWNKAGPVTFYAQANVYGIALIDSLRYVAPQPLVQLVAILSRVPTNSYNAISYFSPTSDTISVTGFQIFFNNSGQPVDVVFDDTAAAQALPPVWEGLFQEFYPGFGDSANPNLGGNIAAFAPIDSTQGGDGVGVRIRYFPDTGTFTYHSALYGTKGQVVVIDTLPSVVNSSRKPARRASSMRALSHFLKLH